MITLPFNLVHQKISVPGLHSRASSRNEWAPFKKDLPVLKALTSEQKRTIQFALHMENQWLARYFEALLATHKDLNLQHHSQFITDYYYGIVRMCWAHSKLLFEEREALSKYTGMTRLDQELNRDQTAFFTEVKALAQTMNPSAHESLLRWVYVGTSIFLATAPPPAIELDAPAQPSHQRAGMQIAYADYITHNTGGHLLEPSRLQHNTLLTAMAPLPEALVLKHTATPD